WTDPTSGPGRDGNPRADSARGPLGQRHLGGVIVTGRVRPGQGHRVAGLVVRYGFGERIAGGDRGRPERGERGSGGKPWRGGGSGLVAPGDYCAVGGCGSGSAVLAADAGPASRAVFTADAVFAADAGPTEPARSAGLVRLTGLAGADAEEGRVAEGVRARLLSVDDRFGRGQRGLDGDGEASDHRGARGRGGIHADDLALVIEQGPSRVAGDDIGLD